MSEFDKQIVARMLEWGVPGLSLAIVKDGAVVKAQGYGTTTQGGNVAVTPSTLFQAGSVSKPVAAFGALHLVECDLLSLDEDVNERLSAWKVPENEFTAQQKVTLRRILSHRAGLTVHGFRGYSRDTTPPTLLQILDGAPPSNSEAIRVDIAPGGMGRYSGGGYVLLQQMMIDATGLSFPILMRATVLGPLGMTDSTFEQPLPHKLHDRAATGYYPDEIPVPGGWHVYPEMAAAGLWTTASDLARFAIGVHEAWTGKATPVISQAMAREMLTTQENTGVSLGLFVKTESNDLQFSHEGRDEGFDSTLQAFAASGRGAAIMINANDDASFCDGIIDIIAKVYQWTR